jgi:hypothetical protein
VTNRVERPGTTNLRDSAMSARAETTYLHIVNAD